MALPVPVFLLGLIALVMVAAKVTPGMIVEKLRSRERLEYEPEPEPVPGAAAAAAVAAGKGAAFSAKQRRHAIDIPTDEEPPEEYQEERVGFFNKKPRVKSPDMLLEQHNAADAAASAQTASEAPAAPLGTKPDPLPAPVNPTAQVKPLSMEEAADLAGDAPVNAQFPHSHVDHRVFGHQPEAQDVDDKLRNDAGQGRSDDVHVQDTDKNHAKNDVDNA